MAGVAEMQVTSGLPRLIKYLMQEKPLLLLKWKFISTKSKMMKKNA
jgi:hypothetical protein